MKGSVIVFLAVITLMSGCSKKNNEDFASKNNDSGNVEAVSNQEIQAKNDNENVDRNKLPENPLKEVPEKIDLDFTKMNYNMASSIMFEMMVEPEKYIDKNVKINGQFHTSVHEGTRYFAVINWDLTGCCPTGLNFIPPDNMVFPYFFPEGGSIITVTGTMKLASDGENEQLCFFAASITE